MDGFTSAWIVKKICNNEVEFHGGVHSLPPPDIKSRDVIMVDFCYPADQLLQISNDANSVLILDHHKTALMAYECVLPLVKHNTTAIFDITKSGAMIAWEYFFPNQDPPDFVKYVQDADLWLFQLPNSKEVLMNTASYDYDFDVWSSLLTQPIDQMVSDGKAILRKHLKDVGELSSVTKRMMTIGGHVVPVMNMPYTLVSDAANKASVNFPFAACYWDTPNGRVFGLRSQSDGVDVSTIAEIYGGGGHKHASGFRIPFDKLEELGLK